MKLTDFRTAVRNGEISEEVEVFDFSKDHLRKLFIRLFTSFQAKLGWFY